MQNNIDRAKQFMPFDALKGLKEEIENRKELRESKKILSNDQIDELDKIMHSLKRNNLVKVEYYSNLSYKNIIGRIKKIDVIYKRLILFDKVISFDDIRNIEVISK